MYGAETRGAIWPFSVANMLRLALEGPYNPTIHN